MLYSNPYLKFMLEKCTNSKQPGITLGETIFFCSAQTPKVLRNNFIPKQMAVNMRIRPRVVLQQLMLIQWAQNILSTIQVETTQMQLTAWALRLLTASQTCS